MKVAVVSAFASLLLLLSGAQGQANPPMSANTGFSPGDSFTLFVDFKDPMPEVASISCTFALQGSPHSGQKDFPNGFACTGEVHKDDATHYHATVQVRQGAASGTYVLNTVQISIGGVTHTYTGASLPAPPTVNVRDPKIVKFAPIEQLNVKQ
jgi:hypothetical protein